MKMQGLITDQGKVAVRELIHRDWISLAAHGALLMLEIGVLIVLIGVPFCNRLPLADRCYEGNPSSLRLRLTKGQGMLVEKITQCRVYCSTKGFDDMRDNPNVVVDLNKLKSCDEVEISLPKGLLNFRIDFYYQQSHEPPASPPVLQEITLNGKALVQDWFHECRLEKIRAVGWSYVKKPCLNGHLVELVLCGGLGCVLVLTLFIMYLLRKSAKTECAIRR